MVLSNLGDIKACIKKLKYTGESENEGSLVPWHKMTSRIKAIDALFNINFSQILRQEFYNHRHKSMVSKVTIAIDEMVTAQPLGPMVFQWFFGQSTIGDDGFQWLPTIGPTMRW